MSDKKQTSKDTKNKVDNLNISMVSKITGVSVRTLHYYDETGLLVPIKDKDNNYRIYTKRHLETLQQILFFKELGFELKDIKVILDNPTFNKKEILKKQKRLLKIKRDRIDKLIEAIDEITNNNKEIDFTMFNNEKYENEIEKYKKEAKEKYGKMYDELESNMKKLTKKEENKKMDMMMQLFKEVSEHMEEGIESKNVQDKVEEWYNFINDTFYTCDLNTYRGLGNLYVADTRFEKNMNEIREGFARFFCDAINYFCDERSK